jgi:hypothetical protein
MIIRYNSQLRGLGYGQAQGADANYAALPAYLQAVVDSVFPPSRLKDVPGFGQTVYDAVIQAVATQQIPSGTATCSTNAAAGSAEDATLTKEAGSITSSVLVASGVGAPFAPIVNGISSLVASIFGGHAQAVAEENDILCAAIPAANQALTQVIQQYQTGAYTAAQVQQALAQLLSAFQAAVAPIIKNDSSDCNASCVNVLCLQGAIGSINAMVAQMEASGGPASASATASGGAAVSSVLTPGSPLPGWVPWLLAAEALLLLVW